MCGVVGDVDADAGLMIPVKIEGFGMIIGNVMIMIRKPQSKTNTKQSKS